MDVSEATFQTAVLERSKSLPVVVDFWAEWCAPCRQLGPLLERAAAARAGRLELVKIDVDANPGLARAYGIQGIPAVKAFRDGQVVAEFVGVRPAPGVEQFFDSLLPSPAEGLIAQGDEASLRQALELEPTRADAAVALGGLLIARGEEDEALTVLRRVPRSFAAEGLAARIELGRRSEPDLSEAFSALDAGDAEAALDLLIAALPSADGAKDDIRRVIVGILEQLGVESPLARESRRRLASALY